MDCKGHVNWGGIYYCYGYCREQEDLHTTYEKPKRKSSKTKAELLEEIAQLRDIVEPTKTALDTQGKQLEDTLQKLAKSEELLKSTQKVLKEREEALKTELATVKKKLEEAEKDLANYNKNPVSGTSRMSVLEID